MSFAPRGRFMAASWSRSAGGNTALFRSEAEPLRRLSEILRTALAHFIHEAETGLRQCIALFAGEAIPLRSLTIILRHALTRFMHVAERRLRYCIALFSQ